MQILTNVDNTVNFKGTITKELLPNTDVEVYKIVDGDNTSYADLGFNLFEVAELPTDYEDMKYCYTEELGFYENPNKPQPSETERIATLEENLGVANGLISDLSDTLLLLME